jgi:15-cis-phytoene synthase
MRSDGDLCNEAVRVAPYADRQTSQRKSSAGGEKANSVSPSVGEAYRACREIARREAKNFYYAFVALPDAKRDAICAVYAFMRHADDLSDDESISIDKRRIRMAAWLDHWHQAAQGEPTVNPVFIALAHAQTCFNIPTLLLDQLVEGVAMDLHREKQNGRPEQFSDCDVYNTFDELYQYCYLVASVVGLACIRIFGYTDERAEKLAEETGIAFQLTNILRDVREDMERGRVYLPLEDLHRHGVSIPELSELASTQGLIMSEVRSLLQAEAIRAEHYYKSGIALLPLISADARPALWVLIHIYHGLLKKIERSQYEVFARRVQLSTAKKLWILGCGLLQSFFNRFRAETEQQP